MFRPKGSLILLVSYKNTTGCPSLNYFRLVKFISNINQYKNMKIKTLKYNTNMYFNTQCVQNNLSTEYAKIKIQHSSAGNQIY